MPLGSTSEFFVNISRPVWMMLNSKIALTHFLLQCGPQRIYHSCLHWKLTVSCGLMEWRPTCYYFLSYKMSKVIDEKLKTTFQMEVRRCRWTYSMRRMQTRSIMARQTWSVLITEREDDDRGRRYWQWCHLHRFTLDSNCWNRSQFAFVPLLGSFFQLCRVVTWKASFDYLIWRRRRLALSSVLCWCMCLSYAFVLVWPDFALMQ